MITVDGTRKLEDGRVLACFSVNGRPFQRYVDPELKGQALRDYLDAHENEYELICLRHEYPESAGTPEEIYYGDLATFQQWIVDGHIAEVYIGTDPETGDPVTEERVIEKVPWAGTHPTRTRIIDGEKLSTPTLAAFNAASTISELKAALLTILQGD